MLSIARLTFMEVFRKRIFLVTLLLSVLFILLYGVALDFVSEELRTQSMRGSQLILQQIIGSQLLGAGLYFSSFLLALLAIMGSVGAIASELENGLLHAVVSKPIPRREIVLGKFLGYGSMLAVYALVLYTAVLGLNQYYSPAVLSLLTAGGLISGALVFILQPLVLLGVALVFSTLLRTLAAGIVSVILYGLGMIGGFLEQVGSAIANASLINIGIATSLVMPSDALFRKMLTFVTGNEANPLSSLSLGPFGVNVPPSNAMLVYTCLYIAACVCLAVYSFERKDL
ncbi:ABC transporter permease [Desulforamulus ruminis]|uniref:ABC transporter permease n=1 Tax=Desulforamulus ruminis TaxID=1564 RepID=UPI0023542C6C|nr:ABC transporter permease subunit [Desulforamulus ruminis]